MKPVLDINSSVLEQAWHWRGGGTDGRDPDFQPDDLVTQLLINQGYLAGNLVRLKPKYREDGTLATAREIGAEAGIHVKSMTIVPRASKLRFIFDRTLDPRLSFFRKPVLLCKPICRCAMASC